MISYQDAKQADRILGGSNSHSSIKNTQSLLNEFSNFNGITPIEDTYPKDKWSALNKQVKNNPLFKRVSNGYLMPNGRSVIQDKFIDRYITDGNDFVKIGKSNIDRIGY